MSNASTLPNSRKQRRGSTTIAGPKKSKYNKRIILLTILLPVLLGIWGTAQTFLSLCNASCGQYATYTPAAQVIAWIFLVVSALCILAILALSTEALTQQESKRIPLISVTIAGLLAGYFYSGAFGDILASIVLRIMY
jgi:hypothetical protein